MNDSTIEIELPKLGESIVSARVVQWLKKEGEAISKDEPLVEVSTDKVNSEIPSPVSGILLKKLVEVDEELDVGAPLAQLSTSDLQEKVAEGVIEDSHEETALDVAFSPAVLSLARTCNLSLEELSTIQGSGNDGRVTKRDVKAYMDILRKDVSSEGSSSDVEHVKMSSIRKAIADNMVRSFYEAPHASLVVEVDVTSLMRHIAKEKAAFLEKHGVKLTITSYIVQALTRTVLEFPMVNASLQDDTIIMKRYVDLGIAVSVEKGVIVPVIKKCQTLSLEEIAKAIAHFAEKAKQGSLSFEDVASGTITMTNFGMSGALIGIPIIRYPEVAIVGIGAIHKKVIATENDHIAVGQVMNMTLTFDHRIIDGMYGAKFLNSLKSRLEQAV